MIGWACDLIYRVIRWRAARLPLERACLLQGRWALRLHGLTTGGQDDDFAEDLYQLVREMPQLLDLLEAETTGNSRGTRRKRQVLAILRQAHADGVASLYGA